MSKPCQSNEAKNASQSRRRGPPCQTFFGVAAITRSFRAQITSSPKASSGQLIQLQGLRIRQTKVLAQLEPEADRIRFPDGRMDWDRAPGSCGRKRWRCPTATRLA